MRNSIPYLIFAFFVLAAEACKKSIAKTGNASINVINATTDLDATAVNFTSSPMPYYLDYSNLVFLNGNQEFGVRAGSIPIVMVSYYDTSKIVFQGNLSLSIGGLYSLYLAGGNTSVDTLLAQDILPTYQDSSAGVRFVNLSPGSPPFSVNLVGNTPSQTEFANLPYKTISSFKTYSAGASAGGIYNFEIREQANGNLVTTATWYYTLYRNCTMVIDGNDSIGVGVSR